MPSMVYEIRFLLFIKQKCCRLQPLPPLLTLITSIYYKNKNMNKL